MKPAGRACILAAIAGAIVFLRSHDAFLHPIAAAEDATQGINYYAHAGAGVFHVYAGYVSALPNIVDCIAMHAVPLAWVPGVQAAFALLMAALLTPAVDCFFRHALRWPSRRSAVAAVLVGTLPVGDRLLVSNTQYAIWPMLGVLLLTLFNPAPATLGGQQVGLAWRALFAASNPLSVIALPVWCSRAVLDRRRPRIAVFHGLLALFTAAYAVFGVAHGAVLHPTWSVVATAIRLAVDRSLLALVVRGVLRINLHDLPVLASLGAFSVACALIWLAHGRGRADKARAGMEIGFPLLCIVALSGLCALGRQDDGGADFVLMSPRYHFLPRVFWAVLLAMAVQAGMAQCRRPAWALAGALIALGLIWQKGVKAYGSHNAVQSAAIGRFLAGADPAGAGDPPRFARIEASGDWSIVIDRRPLPP